MTTRKTKPKAEAEETQEIESPVFATEYFKGAGIPYCKTCGEQLRTDLNGDPICPIQKVGCDRNK